MPGTAWRSVFGTSMAERLRRLIEDGRGFVWALRIARLALAAAFLPAVADRLEVWGPLGAPGVERIRLASPSLSD